MHSSGRILLIDDDESISRAIRLVLVNEGHTVDSCGRGDEGLQRAQSQPYDVILTDVHMPGIDGIELVRRLHAAQPRLPIIVMTGQGTTETAIQATKFGAYEYLLKPFDLTEVVELISKAIETSRMATETVELGPTSEDSLPARDAIVGNSRVMQLLYKEIGRIAAKPVTALIRGETGTGKELIARAIYQHSERNTEAFIAVNCAAIPESLLESELFGHEKGAFTGADQRRIGRFEQADKGTIFLDEISEISPGTQAKLLRVLQERCIQRVGGKETIPVDVRVIAATNRDLELMIKEKKFREDLLYRLNVVELFLPPLRQRTEDITALVAYFLSRDGLELGSPRCSMHPEAIQYLKEQPWPGNVRQLQNVIRKVILLARGYTITVEHIKQALSSTPPEFAPVSGETGLAQMITDLLNQAKRNEIDNVHDRLMDSVEKELFSQAIELARGNQAKAARWLGVSRVTMHEKLQIFGLHPSRRLGRGDSTD